jgi:hypothetical protein
VYFLIYQATNGTWSCAGYSYQAENFPTRVRGTAAGWLGSMNIGGLVIGSALNRPGFARGWGSGHLAPLGDGVSIHDFAFNWGHVFKKKLG